MSLTQYANIYHAYVFGTSFWYFLRGTVRVVDPATVCGWFRPPAQPAEPNDLELYTTRVDAFGLLALSMLLLLLADAVPLPTSITGSSLAVPGPPEAKRPYARAVIVITILHHIATGIGSFSHWILPSHHTGAMDIGLFGNLGFTMLGLAALRYGFAHESSAHGTRETQLGRPDLRKRL